MLNYFPKYFTSKAIILYLAALFVVSILFFSRMLSFVWWIFGLVDVIGFFYFSNHLTGKWSNLTPGTFTKKIFTYSLILRVTWVLFSYFFYILMTGQPFEFSVGDAKMYQRIGEALAETGFGNYENLFFGIPVSDRGYGTYLGIVYMIFGNSILIARLFKAILGSYMCVLIYKLTTRTFNEETGRIAAIFCMLMPNLIYYSGLHLKEAEMVFLTVWFMERVDYIIRNNKLSFINIFPALMIAGSLFFFRTVLGVTAIFALFTALIFSSKRILSWGKRAGITIWLVVAIAYFVGGNIANEVEEIWQSRMENQEKSLEFRSIREGGNVLAKYASKSIFVPLIFIIPFPTMVDVPAQENQQLLHGGNYVKNILAFFVLFALFLIIKEKVWRDYLLIGSFTFAYLIIIAVSAFAQSERFHLPVLPFLMIFAAYGVTQISNKEKKVFSWYLVFIFVAIVAWSWFKLKGRGMI